MANSDNAPTGPRKGASAGIAANAISESREEQLEAQISRLQEDLKAVTATLAKLTNEKVHDARDTATTEYRNLVRRGKHMVDEAGDQAGAYEKQLKDTIREKPLTAVAAAAGVGFIFALLTRH